MKAKHQFLFIAFTFFVTIVAHSQMAFYQDQFKGGVTGAGYSTGALTAGPNTGSISIHIAPGSTIRKAYLLAARLGTQPTITTTLNAKSYTFDASTQVTPPFINYYGVGKAGAVHAVDITTDIDPAIKDYTLAVPFQGTFNAYQNKFIDFYLLIAYNNPTLACVNIDAFLNTQDLTTNPIVNWGTVNFGQAINTSNDVGLALFSGYSCEASDGSRIAINTTTLGNIFGPDINEGNITNCAGPIGSFYYQNSTLFGLSDDHPDQAMNGADALSNVKNILTNNALSASISYTDATIDLGPPFFSDNNLWGAFFVYSASGNTLNVVSSTIAPTCHHPSGSLIINSISNGTGPYFLTELNSVTSITFTPTYTISPISVGSHTYIVSEVNGCKTQTIIASFAQTSLSVSTSGTLTCTTNSVILTSNLNSPTTSYTWMPQHVNTPTVMVTTPGNYTLTINDPTNGCNGSAQVTVVKNQSVITANFNYSPQEPSLINPTISFTNLSQGASTYQWYSNGILFSTQTNPNYTLINEGTYMFTLIAKHGTCTDTASASINIKDEFSLYMPNSFTPNDDGLNDTFYPFMRGYSPKNYSFMIFDRWGKLIYESKDTQDTQWNGYYKNELCQDGTYTWKLNINTNTGVRKALTGHVMLLK